MYLSVLIVKYDKLFGYCYEVYEVIFVSWEEVFK